MAKNNHEFAVFSPSIDLLPNHCVITDPDLVHRILTVLRLKVGDSLIIFNRAIVLHVRLESFSKKSLSCSVVHEHKVQPLLPEIHWMLPLLEREAFESALYSLAAMGATSVTPVTTQKSRHKWGTEKDYERAQRIMIAACEQAKQFVIPHLNQITSLEKIVIKPDHRALFFDVSGYPTIDLMTQLRDAQEKKLWCLVGPEGDLTPEEKTFLKQTSWTFCRLTPTVLRACDAVTVGLGIIRSCL